MIKFNFGEEIIVISTQNWPVLPKTHFKKDDDFEKNHNFTEFGHLNEVYEKIVSFDQNTGILGW